MNANERAALLKVREGLATGKIRAADPDSGYGCQFDIGATAYNAGCGTVACIGGWMGLFMGMSERDADQYVIATSESQPESGLYSGLYSLFYPSVDWSLITPKVAVAAIDSFLETGKPMWHQALKSDPDATLQERILREAIGFDQMIVGDE